MFSLNPTPLIVAAVFVSAWFGGRYPGLLACLLSDLAIDFFFESPAYQFNLLAPVHLVRLGILSVISLLASARKGAEDRLRARESQQAAVALLGQKALSAIPLKELFDEAAKLVKKTLDADFSAVTEVLPEKKLRYVAGSGWKTGVIGHQIDYMNDSSPAGYILKTGEPQIFKNFKKDTRFVPSQIITNHHISSGLGVAVRHREQTFGVLGAFTRRVRIFSQDDVNFLQSVANVLAEAIERQRTEDAVREQREWLKTTLASIGDAVIATDREGAITFMNPVAEHLTEWDETRAAGKPLEEVFRIIGEKDRREAESPVARVIREEKVFGQSEQTVLISKSGREIPIDTSAAPIKDENKSVSGVVLVFHDVTERKKAERAQRFLSDAAGVMTASLDLDKTLKSLAKLSVPALADLCIIDLAAGKSELRRVTVSHADPLMRELAEAVRNCSDFDLSAPSGIPRVLRTGKPEIHSAETGFLPAEMVCGAVKESKVLPPLGAVSAMIVPLIGNGRTIGVFSFLLTGDQRRFETSDLQLAEDFAHRAALAIENARLYQSVQEANRIKDEFLATLSHELRTPLNSILGWSSLLLSSDFSGEQTVRAVATIERNARLQKQIVEDVLDVSRIITGKFRIDAHSIDLRSVIEAAIETVAPSAEARDIAIDFSPEFGVPLVSGDAGRLQQVMWNLLSNAVKFTPKGGRVAITLDVFESNVRIRVTDTGRGISPDFLPFVFDRFKQADSSRTREHGGLGLGLAIVRYIVELHGGEVSAESAGENRGSTFTISLPVMPLLRSGLKTAEDENGARPEARRTEDRAALKNLRILVVDDDTDAQFMLATALEQSGAAVHTVSSSVEGLEFLAAARPDILISDIGMPEEDGYTFIKKVRDLDLNDNGQIPAIALTAYAREEDRAQALAAGYQIHLPKPIDRHELIEAIKSLLSYEAQ